MTKKKHQSLICLITLLAGILINPYIVLGSSGTGQVIVPSEISFYEEETNSKSTSQSSSKIADNNSMKTNNRGILPKTGEFIEKYLVIGISVLLLIILLFFLRRRREDVNNEI